MKLKSKNTNGMLRSLLCIAVVLLVILFAFRYRKEIEDFAITGYLGVFVACIAATATVLLPAPGLIVVIQYSRFLNPFIVVLIGGLGTSIGEMLGYLLGRSGNDIAEINTTGKYFDWFVRHSASAVILFSLIPFPIFDIVGIAAGMTKMNPIKFWLFCFIGKVIKMGFFVIAFDSILHLLNLIL